MKSFPLNITSNAKNYLSDMLSSYDSKYIHLSVLSGGCSGFQYKWDFTQSTDEGTLIDDILVIDNMAEMFILGCTIDYVNELGGSYLKVVNPNASAQCGCGESFAI
jgi:iron-sulfur cluster assembly accessory protein